MKDLFEIYKWSVGHFFVTRLLHDVFTSRSCRAVSPFLSFLILIILIIIILLLRNSYPLHYKKICWINDSETFCDISQVHCADGKGGFKRLTHDLDLYGVKVTLYI